MVENDKDAYEIDEDIDIQFDNEKFTQHEIDELAGLGIIRRTSRSSTGLNRIALDLSTLREIAFEYSILKEVANSVEVDVMRYIREADTDRVTTGEIADALDRPPATISRTLSNLVEKNQIRKIKDGLYQRY